MMVKLAGVAKRRVSLKVAENTTGPMIFGAVYDTTFTSVPVLKVAGFAALKVPSPPDDRRHSVDTGAKSTRPVMLPVAPAVITVGAITLIRPRDCTKISLLAYR